VADTIEYAPQIRTAAEGRSAQQKARDWLQGVVDEEDDVKDLVMQELWKKEDFPNA
jgi:plasmid stability protein